MTMSERSKRSVILLKAPTADDLYGPTMRNHNLDPIFIAPSHFVFKNLRMLRAKLMEPHKYAGIIFPAPRCVQAVHEALDRNPLPSCWRSLHNYSLGNRTHSSAWFTFQNLPTMGDHAANAHNLCDLIVETFGPKRDLPLLMPCGNGVGHTLRLRLVAQGFRVDACEVYESQSHPDFAEQMRHALKYKRMETIVFFGPSSVRCSLQFFEKYNVSLKDRKLIAVGAGTRKAMEDAGMEMDAVVDPTDLGQLIRAIKT
ncbi:uroporphyrinogen-III synthase [Drosophila bipectinata]|uniref:uroporphyrinogen-III synthase n=1 Tax=Drosophila bipectinata TaxID=42026 RepID=UPI001C8A2950|nr:uroporphyrinogen-III synthase [Drosophila bipectinata]